MKVYIVMSTSDHESEYTVHGVFSSRIRANAYADALLTELNEDWEDELEDNSEFETGWNVWLEERDLVE